jgi:hypothetical protein
VVLAAETGFVLAEEPRTICAPDAAFISKGRLVPRQGKFYALAPHPTD